MAVIRVIEHRARHVAGAVIDRRAAAMDDVDRPARLEIILENDSGAQRERRRQRVGRPEAIEERRSEPDLVVRSEEHTSELQSLMRSSYAVFCLKKKKSIHKL